MESSEGPSDVLALTFIGYGKSSGAKITRQSSKAAV